MSGEGTWAASFGIGRAIRPPTSSDRLGIDRRRLKRAIHKIKAASDLGGADRVIISDDGDVTNANAEFIGNIFNEE